MTPEIGNIIDVIFSRSPDLLAFGFEAGDKIYMQFEGMDDAIAMDVSDMIDGRKKTLIELAGDMQIAGWTRDYDTVNGTMRNIRQYKNELGVVYGEGKMLITK